MSSANVTSIDALKRFRLAVQQFDDDAQAALTELMLEMRRALQWIEVDRARYWPNQLRKANEAVTHARIRLEQKQITITSEDAPSCVEEKKALQAAKSRVRFVEDKIHAVRRWQVQCKQEADELHGQLTKLSGQLDTNLPRAIAKLERHIRALDAYAARRPSDTEAASQLNSGRPTDPQRPPSSSPPQSPSQD